MTASNNVIYGLYDTEAPGLIRYVGQTSVGMKKRLQGHWHQSDKRNLPVGRWIQSIGRDRLTYTILAEPEYEDLDPEEIKWIADYRSIGEADLNLADGGSNTRVMKITPEEIHEVVALADGGMSGRQIAKKMGYSDGLMSLILAGRLHSEISGIDPDANGPRWRTRTLSDDTAREIWTLLRAGKTQTHIMKKLGVSRGMVSDINLGRTYRDITGLDGVQYHGRAKKLTEDQAWEIWQMVGPDTKTTEFKAIAEEYGVTGQLVRAIRDGKSWTHVTGADPASQPDRRKPKLADNQVSEIWRALQEGIPRNEVADLFRLPRTTIDAIRAGRTYRHVTGLPKQVKVVKNTREMSE